MRLRAVSLAVLSGVLEGCAAAHEIPDAALGDDAGDARCALTFSSEVSLGGTTAWPFESGLDDRVFVVTTSDDVTETFDVSLWQEGSSSADWSVVARDPEPRWSWRIPVPQPVVAPIDDGRTLILWEECEHDETEPHPCGPRRVRVRPLDTGGTLGTTRTIDGVWVPIRSTIGRPALGARSGPSVIWALEAADRGSLALVDVGPDGSVLGLRDVPLDPPPVAAALWLGRSLDGMVALYETQVPSTPSTALFVGELDLAGAVRRLLPIPAGIGSSGPCRGGPSDEYAYVASAGAAESSELVIRRWGEGEIARATVTPAGWYVVECVRTDGWYAVRARTRSGPSRSRLIVVDGAGVLAEAEIPEQSMAIAAAHRSVALVAGGDGGDSTTLVWARCE